MCCFSHFVWGWLEGWGWWCVSLGAGVEVGMTREGQPLMVTGRRGVQGGRGRLGKGKLPITSEQVRARQSPEGWCSLGWSARP